MSGRLSHPARMTSHGLNRNSFVNNSHDSNRRDFLTGRAVQNELRRAGDAIADGILDAADFATAPVAGETVRLETRAMGCPWFVIMNPGPPRQVMVATDAFDIVRDVEQLLTIYRDDSDVAELNRTAYSRAVRVKPELFEFLSLCQQLYAATDGAFDPAAGALIELWKKRRLENSVPDDDEIADALSRSGLGNVELNANESTVRYLREGLRLDFASIGKGYGIDKAAEHLKYEDVHDFLVHGGQSSLYAAGTHAGHDGWPIGIKNPLFTDQRYATLLLKESGMATSGSNIQYFRHRGQRFGHLLDPRTGRTASGLLSVSVIAPSATMADALSTAFYVMGLDKSLTYCDHHPEIGAILVPPPSRGRKLEPVVKNISPDRLFFEENLDAPPR